MKEITDEDKEILVNEHGFSNDYLNAPREGENTAQWKAKYVKTTADWKHYYGWVR